MKSLLTALGLLAFGLLPFPALAQASAQPTIVFEAGLGDRGNVWRKVIRELGDDFPSFRYDRPGYGRSTRTQNDRDPCTVARELRIRLQNEGIAPPYLMVGHSLGGQYAYAFARMYPEETAGLVLVDATPPGHWEKVQREFPDLAAAANILRAITFSRTMKQEFADQDQCLDQLPRTRMEFPVHVLVRTEPDGGGGQRFLDYWQDYSRTWLGLTGAHKLTLVPGTGHYIQKDRPAFLADFLHHVLRSRRQALFGSFCQNLAFATVDLNDRCWVDYRPLSTVDEGQGR